MKFTDPPNNAPHPNPKWSINSEMVRDLVVEIQNTTYKTMHDKMGEGKIFTTPEILTAHIMSFICFLRAVKDIPADSDERLCAIGNAVGVALDASRATLFAKYKDLTSPEYFIGVMFRIAYEIKVGTDHGGGQIKFLSGGKK